MRDSFGTYHPFVNFVYFAAVMTFGMLYMHPVFQVIALACAISYSILLGGRKAIRFQSFYMLPLLLFMAVLNPLFNHAGVTILFYLRSGNPVTLESILYGAAAAVMFVTVIIWFSCFNAVMTSDKFIFLFGRMMPALSLLLSMALRFVPRYIAQLKTISNAQRCVGRDMTQGNLIRRARNGLTIVSMLTTWALENAIETADSMKARGYGLPGRTSFSLFRLDNRDKMLLAVLTALIAIIMIGAAFGENSIRFFPSIRLIETTAFSVVVYAAYLLLGLMPVIIHIAEAIKWKSTQSEM